MPIIRREAVLERLKVEPPNPRRYTCGANSNCDQGDTLRAVVLLLIVTSRPAMLRPAWARSRISKPFLPILALLRKGGPDVGRDHQPCGSARLEGAHEAGNPSEADPVVEAAIAHGGLICSPKLNLASLRYDANASRGSRLGMTIRLWMAFEA